MFNFLAHLIQSHRRLNARTDPPPFTGEGDRRRRWRGRPHARCEQGHSPYSLVSERQRRQCALLGCRRLPTIRHGVDRGRVARLLRAHVHRPQPPAAPRAKRNRPTGCYLRNCSPLSLPPRSSCLSRTSGSVIFRRNARARLNVRIDARSRPLHHASHGPPPLLREGGLSISTSHPA